MAPCATTDMCPSQGGRLRQLDGGLDVGRAAEGRHANNCGHAPRAENNADA